MCLQEPIFQQVAAVPAIVPQLTHLKPSHLLPYQLLLALQVMIILLLVSKQWGHQDYSETGYVTINFPITFASSTYILIRTNISDLSGSNLSPRSLGYKSKTKSSAQMYAAAITGIDYLVIGK